MARLASGIRYLPPPGGIVEVTIRTLESRYFLAPTDDEVNELILGVLGRALALHKGILLYAFTVLSNHYHMLLFAPDAQTLASFEKYFNGNLARVMNRKLGRRGRFWEKRYASIRVLDADAEVSRLRYILGQGCKEGRCASPRWARSYFDALAPRRQGAPRKVVRPNGLLARPRNGSKVSPAEFVIWYPVELSPLRCWRALSEVDRRMRIAELVLSLAQETKLANAELGRVPVGPLTLRRQSPAGRPTETARRSAPRYHASTADTARAFLEEYTAVGLVYREAAERIKAGDASVFVNIPAGCFPPPMPFRRIGRDTDELIESVR